MRRYLGVLVAAVVVSGCGQVERSAELTAACTAVLEVIDDVENLEAEQLPLAEFAEAAAEADDEELLAAARRAEEADRRGDDEAVRTAMLDARERCQRQGAA